MTNTSPIETFNPGVGQFNQTSPICVWEPTDKTQTAEANDAIRERHIVSCGMQMEKAYARFQAHGNTDDREEARQWKELQRMAIARRSPAQLQRMEQAIDEGLDYFQTEGERAHRMAQARGLA